MNVEKDFLIGVPVPERTETYSPVPHAVLVDKMVSMLRDKGYQVENEGYRIDNGGRKLVGQVSVNADHPDFRMMIAFRNSYDKSMSVGFAAGAEVMICENGCVAGDITMIRKHTGDVLNELEAKIAEAINYLDRNFEIIVNDSEKMKSVQVDPRLTAELLGRLVIEDQIINTMQLNIIKGQLNGMSDHFKGTSAWDLYNHCTHSLKRSHTTRKIDDHIELHNFFMNEVV